MPSLAGRCQFMESELGDTNCKVCGDEDGFQCNNGGHWLSWRYLHLLFDEFQEAYGGYAADGEGRRCRLEPSC